MSLEILKGPAVPSDDGPSGELIEFDELRSWLRDRTYFRRALRYRSVRLHVIRIEALAKPLLTSIAIRLLSRGRCEIVDATGKSATVGLRSILAATRRFAVDLVALPGLLRAARRRVDALADEARARPSTLELASPVLYLRPEPQLGLSAGGSVGHTAGVLNHLGEFAGGPIWVTTEALPTVREDIETHVILPGDRFADFHEPWRLALDVVFEEAVPRVLGPRRPSFVYQRYGLMSLVGASVAQQLGVPLVLEYNGSEVWIADNWGKGLRHRGLARAIEDAALAAADLVVVVSDAMADELSGRGIDSRSILVNPNGVDPSRYSPEVDGSGVRGELDLLDDYAIGFIGTYRPWHGAENLAHAFNRLMDRRADLRERVRMLMIGDGVGLPATRAIIEQGGHASRVVFTGAVPQQDGPSYLAACDLLVSPHVPNPDGSRFFGSPTKLFEYMAMGKPIVASGLEQIADVLEDGRTAVVVEPGNIDALVDGLSRVIDSPEFGARLGAAARRQAVEKHTWLEHTRRIIERLEELCA